MGLLVHMVTNSIFRVRGTATVFSKAAPSFYIPIWPIWSFFLVGKIMVEFSSLPLTFAKTNRPILLFSKPHSPHLSTSAFSLGVIEDALQLSFGSLIGPQSPGVSNWTLSALSEVSSSNCYLLCRAGWSRRRLWLKYY